jgi:hypothetical protein
MRRGRPLPHFISEPEQGQYSDLLHAARVTLDVGIVDEDEIVPTPVCAANRREVSSLKGAYQSFPSGGERFMLSGVTISSSAAKARSCCAPSTEHRKVPVQGRRPALAGGQGAERRGPHGRPAGLEGRVDVIGTSGYDVREDTISAEGREA